VVVTCRTTTAPLNRLPGVLGNRDLSVACLQRNSSLRVRAIGHGPEYGDEDGVIDFPEEDVGWYEDRERAVRYIDALRAAIAEFDEEASYDAKLTAHAAVANAQALILFGDTLRQAMETLRDDIAPQFGRGFRDI
jgi:hypothetical protein